MLQNWGNVNRTLSVVGTATAMHANIAEKVTHGRCTVLRKSAPISKLQVPLHVITFAAH
eukprot:SAG25_NODE_206_length_11883_cov_5.639511_3_plen_59_part_00